MIFPTFYPHLNNFTVPGKKKKTHHATRKFRFWRGHRVAHAAGVTFQIPTGETVRGRRASLLAKLPPLPCHFSLGLSEFRYCSLAPPFRSQWTAQDEQALAHPFPPQQPEAGEHILFQPFPLRAYLTSRSLQLLGPCPVPPTTAAVTPTFEQR